MAEERVAAHLAVGDDVESRVLLQRDDLVDGPVLDALESGRRQRAALDLVARLEKKRQAQKAADDVAAIGGHRGLRNQNCAPSPGDQAGAGLAHLDAGLKLARLANMITVNMHEAKTRLSELVKAVEERNETVVLCRDGREVAEIRRRVKRRAARNLTPDPRFRVELAPGYRPAEPLTDDEWPETVR